MAAKVKRRNVRKLTPQYRMTRHELLEYFRNMLSLTLRSYRRVGDNAELLKDVEQLCDEAERLKW